MKYQAVIRFAVNTALWDAWEAIFTDLENDTRQEDALDFFNANREEMLEGAKVLWEARASYYDLMAEKVSVSDASFNSEMQNQPIDPDNCAFNEEWLDFYEDGEVDFTESRFLFIGANDPSLGKNKKSDTSAIITVAKDTRTGYLYVVDADIERRRPDAIIDDVIECSNLRTATISSLSISAHTAITHGVDVDTSQGTEHYGLTTEDQINIQNLSLQAATQPGLRIPYHADGGLCRMYSPEEINAVARAAISHVTYHTTYHNHLKAWANRTQDTEELQGIHYGAALPEDLQQSMDALLAEMAEQQTTEDEKA